MGKAYEALRRSGNNQNLSIFQTQHDFNKAIFPFGINHGNGSFYPEGFESLKTNFLTRYAKQSVKTILFSGVSPGCGTSTMAACFAYCLAKDTQHRVLLIDANLRSPSLNRLFALKAHCGLLDLLKSEDQKGFEIEKLGPDFFYVLSSGDICENPVQLLESRNFYRLIEKFRASLDYVIIDGPIASV
jgi:Mrp family chromosome partitioning ATPase